MNPTWVDRAIRSIGSTTSLAVHTAIFVAALIAVPLGASTETVLLVLTTAVSLEAIYLAIFIQMSVNRQSASIAEVEEDIDEIQEDVEEIQEDVDEIQEDVDEIQEDVEDIQEEIVDEDGNPAEQLVPGPTGSGEAATLARIERELARVAAEIAALRQSR